MDVDPMMPDMEEKEGEGSQPSQGHPVTPSSRNWHHPGPRGLCGMGSHGAGKVHRQVWREAAMEGLRAMGLCSITVLLGTALLLLAPSSTQALSNPMHKGLPTDQDLDKEIILDVEVLEEREHSEEVKPGRKVMSRKAWKPLQVQAEPEEDRDHLYHPQDDAREADARNPPWMLSVEVQNGPEEDRDYLYHS
ncbi:proline-rich acidic protein 1 [Pithys albifrons albifrons]|uniref:proline-rich acidic protein 1 n=1 Tax=Pithys albifrons albifrons TaxID=3385563 RepID=UPI003A5CB955